MHIQRVMERAENVTHVPQANSEFVQAGTGARAGVSVGLRVRSRVRRQAHSEVVPVRHAHACAHALAVGPRPCSPRRYYLPHGPTPYPRRSSPRPYYCTYPRPYYPPAALLPAGAAVRGGPVLTHLLTYLPTYCRCCSTRWASTTAATTTSSPRTRGCRAARASTPSSCTSPR